MHAASYIMWRARIISKNKETNRASLCNNNAFLIYTQAQNENNIFIILHDLSLYIAHKINKLKMFSIKSENHTLSFAYTIHPCSHQSISLLLILLLFFAWVFVQLRYNLGCRLSFLLLSLYLNVHVTNSNEKRKFICANFNTQHTEYL